MLDDSQQIPNNNQLINAPLKSCHEYKQRDTLLTSQKKNESMFTCIYMCKWNIS